MSLPRQQKPAQKLPFQIVCASQCFLREHKGALIFYNLKRWKNIIEMKTFDNLDR